MSKNIDLNEIETNDIEILDNYLSTCIEKNKKSATEIIKTNEVGVKRKTKEDETIETKNELKKKKQVNC